MLEDEEANGLGQMAWSTWAVDKPKMPLKPSRSPLRVALGNRERSL